MHSIPTASSILFIDNFSGTQTQNQNYHPTGADILNFGIDLKEERIRLAQVSTDIDYI